MKMTRNEQREVLKDTIKNVDTVGVYCTLKHVIENTDKTTRDMIEKYLKENYPSDYKMGYELNFGDEE